MDRKIRIVLIGLLAWSVLLVAEFSLAKDKNTRNHSEKKSSQKEKKKKEEEEASSPCDGLLALLNRPTVADSPCVAPVNKLIGEFGYSYINFIDHGQGQRVPDLQLRLGLLGNTEVTVLPPSYVQQSHPYTSGWTATIAGVKHLLCSTKKSVLSVEALFTIPSGSRAFGSAGLGMTYNGIYEYNFTKKFSFTTMLGVSSLTAPPSDGGDRYTSFNPDVVFVYQPKSKYQFFLEVHGATKTFPDQGPGANCNVGIQYLLNKKLEIDLTYGQRIFGRLGDFNNFISFGMGFIT
jgi:hypothetical protein